MVCCASGSYLFAQRLPDNIDPNKCYDRCLTPTKYKVVEQQVVTREASTRLEIVPAEFATEERQHIAEEPNLQLAVTPAEYDYTSERVMIKEPSTRLEISPATFTTVEEQILVREAYTRLVNIPAVYETVMEKVLVKEAASRFVNIPAEYEYVTDKMLIKEPYNRLTEVPTFFLPENQSITSKEATTKVVKQMDPACTALNNDDCMMLCLVNIPAEMLNIPKQIVKREAYTQEISVDATYITRSRRVVKQLSTVREEPIPAEYRFVPKRILKEAAKIEEIIVPAAYVTITKQILQETAKVQEMPIPADYEELTVMKLKSAASYTENIIPARTENITVQVTVSPAYSRPVAVEPEVVTIKKQVVETAGTFSLWEEILCPNAVSLDILHQVESKLIAQRYLIGSLSITPELKPITQAALEQFQRDNALPVGNLNIKTLNFLNITY